jgi:hypothetical protein
VFVSPETAFTLASRARKTTSRRHGHGARIGLPAAGEGSNVLRLIRLLASVLVTLTALSATAQTEVFGLDAGEHAVGFRLLEDEDGSRAVTGGRRGAAHPRPIRTYLWYPAEAARIPAPMRFGQYAKLADDDIWPEQIAGELRDRLKYANGPLARSLSAERLSELLERPMRAVENAAPARGPFPLIVIGLGLYYESPITFSTTAEYLAGRGFVVATAPLVGAHTSIVKLDVQDLETQVRDLEFVIARVREFPFVDAERLGVIGFDQGGMAGVVLAMRNRDVDAFVSLDSGIQYPHPSGIPRSSPHYDPLALRVPWLHVEPTRNQPDGTPLFDEAVHADRYWLKVGQFGHADFTSYALVEGRGEVVGYWAAVTPDRVATHRIVMDYVRHFFAAHLNASDVSMALFDQALRGPLPEASMTLDHRAPVAAPIGFEELVRNVVEGDGEEAVVELRALAATTPPHPMLTEFNLGRLCVSLLQTWELPEQTLPLLEYMLELYPTSVNGKLLMAEAQAALENYPAAIALYEQLLAQFPAEPQITSRLAQLRSSR